MNKVPFAYISYRTVLMYDDTFWGNLILRCIEDIFYLFLRSFAITFFEQNLYLKLQKYDEPESNSFRILDSLNRNFR